MQNKLECPSAGASQPYPTDRANPKGLVSSQTWRGVGGDSRAAALFSRLQAGEAGGCRKREKVRGDGKDGARGWAAVFWILELLCGIWPEVLRGVLWVGFSAAGPVPKSGRGSCTSLDPREGGTEETAAWGLEISGALGCSCPRF